MGIKHNARKKREKKGSFHGDVSTSLVKDGKSFQDIWLESPKAPIQQDM